MHIMHIAYYAYCKLSALILHITFNYAKSNTTRCTQCAEKI